jgi:hypothetical protein
MLKTVTTFTATCDICGCEETLQDIGKTYGFSCIPTGWTYLSGFLPGSNTKNTVLICDDCLKAVRKLSKTFAEEE